MNLEINSDKKQPQQFNQIQNGQYFQYNQQFAYNPQFFNQQLQNSQASQNNKQIFNNIHTLSRREDHPSLTFKIVKRRSPWTKEEDDLIILLVNKYGTSNWTLIANEMTKNCNNNNRSGKQCRERWHNHLDPKVNKAYWGEREENILIEKHMELGNKWSDIAKFLPGRTDNSIKNHFYSKLRKYIRRIWKQINKENLMKDNELDPNKYNSEKIYRLLKKSKLSYKNLNKDSILTLIKNNENKIKNDLCFMNMNMGMNNINCGNLNMNSGNNGVNQNGYPNENYNCNANCYANIGTNNTLLHEGVGENNTNACGKVSKSKGKKKKNNINNMNINLAITKNNNNLVTNNLGSNTREESFYKKLTLFEEKKNEKQLIKNKRKRSKKRKVSISLSTPENVKRKKINFSSIKENTSTKQNKNTTLNNNAASSKVNNTNESQTKQKNKFNCKVYITKEPIVNNTPTMTKSSTSLHRSSSSQLVNIKKARTTKKRNNTKLNKINKDDIQIILNSDTKNQNNAEINDDIEEFDGNEPNYSINELDNDIREITHEEYEYLNQSEKGKNRKNKTTLYKTEPSLNTNLYSGPQMININFNNYSSSYTDNLNKVSKDINKGISNNAINIPNSNSSNLNNINNDLLLNSFAINGSSNQNSNSDKKQFFPPLSCANTLNNNEKLFFETTSSNLNQLNNCTNGINNTNSLNINSINTPNTNSNNLNNLNNMNNLNIASVNNMSTKGNRKYISLDLPFSNYDNNSLFNNSNNLNATPRYGTPYREEFGQFFDSVQPQISPMNIPNMILFPSSTRNIFNLDFKNSYNYPNSNIITMKNRDNMGNYGNNFSNSNGLNINNYLGGNKCGNGRTHNLQLDINLINSTGNNNSNISANSNNISRCNTNWGFNFGGENKINLSPVSNSINYSSSKIFNGNNSINF